MKKGFTMIELIFVIVILGILASVAIPRLAGTKADAEISAAVANLRTLVSDAGAYHVVKGDFTGAKWNDITNVPLQNATADATSAANLKVGGKDCIGVQLVEKANDTPAHIKFTKNGTNGSSGTCKQVLESDPLKPYFSSTVAGVTVSNGGAMAIGSSTSIYTAAATTAVAATAAVAPAAQAQAAPKPAAPKPAAPKPAAAKPAAAKPAKGKPPRKKK